MTTCHRPPGRGSTLTGHANKDQLSRQFAPEPSLGAAAGHHQRRRSGTPDRSLTLGDQRHPAPPPTVTWGGNRYEEIRVFVKVGDQLVHAVRSGSGPRTVVGIPGSFGTTEIWEQPFEVLSARYQTVVFDHFGTGETRVPDELVGFESQVGLVTDLLDELGIGRCLLAGDSSMAAVAVEVARRHPERVEALVLVAAGISYAPDAGVHRFVSRLRSDPEPTLEGFVRACLPEDDEGHLRRWLKDIILRTGPSRAARLVESFYEVDIRDRLVQLRVPTTVVHGELDALPSSRLDIARELASLVPGAHLRVINGAGHVPTLSRPFEVAGAIEALLLPPKSPNSPTGSR